MKPERDGQCLFDIVASYAALGVHRTGSDVDQATADWIAAEFRDRGLVADIEAVSFDRWVGEATLTVDGTVIDCLPVPYSWTGEFDSTAGGSGPVEVMSIDPASGGFPFVLEEPAATARDQGASALVISTQHPDGALVGVNRVLGEPGLGLPVVLVAGRDLEALSTGDVELKITANVEPGQTFNVVASNGNAGDPLLLTTPLTGWFGCAGERGTGIAILLDLVEQLADESLLVLATGGHELGHFGAQRWVDSAGSIDIRATVHVGASVAVEQPGPDGTPELIETRMAMTSLDQEVAKPVAAALSPIGLALATSTTSWIGEGQAFCQLDAPLLSVTGAGNDFHTPGDTPERVTSPTSLARVAESFGSAVAALLDAGRQTT